MPRTSSVTPRKLLGGVVAATTLGLFGFTAAHAASASSTPEQTVMAPVSTTEPVETETPEPVETENGAHRVNHP